MDSRFIGKSQIFSKVIPVTRHATIAKAITLLLVTFSCHLYRLGVSFQARCHTGAPLCQPSQPAISPYQHTGNGLYLHSTYIAHDVALASLYLRTKTKQSIENTRRISQS